MSKVFRYYQAEADKFIYEELLSKSKCIVKMFCGTGKSLLMRKCKIIENKKLVVFVFPSLCLIDQFYSDYLDDFSTENILKISSECESTTNPIQIKQFLSKTSDKIICITYQSFKTLLDNLGEAKINVCLFDEAHHAVGETYQKLIFENNICEKQIFFTATPKNANGIIMYDRENMESGMCGNLVYDYSYLRGMNEGYLNPFEIRIDMYTENNNNSIFESLARAILSSGNTRALTFHTDVNTDRNTSVINFVNEKEFKKVFEEVHKREFPKSKKPKKISMVALTASINAKQRKIILDKFDSTKDDEVFIISSCETIGEGIDTKNANMCVFVDPKSSYVKIIQNIGRIVRKIFGVDKPNSTILIPCWVDKTKYLDCQGDKDKCDEVIRQDMGADGNFNGILNVLSALKQEDEDLYDICLHYPDTYSPQEIKSNLEKQGYTIEDIVGEGLLMETIEHLLDIEIDYDDYEDYSEEEMIMKIAEDNDVCIEIHTNSLENPIEQYNGELKGDSIRLYKSFDEETEEDIYQPIIQKETRTKRNYGSIKAPKRENRMCVKVHTNPDIKVLWNITSDLDLTKDICSCVIDCEVVDNWFERLEELKKFIDEYRRRPIQNSKDKIEKQLGNWLQAQQQNYRNKRNSMKDKAKYDLWSKFLKDYNENMKTVEEIWYQNFQELKDFIDTNKRRPKFGGSEHQMATWFGQHDNHYNKKDTGMANEIRYNLWTIFLEEYKEYLKDEEDIWYEKFKQLKEFMDSNERRPNSNSKDKTEKQLGCWLQTQQQNYKKNDRSMKNEKIYNLWTQFLKDYNEYMKTDDDIWYETLEKLKIFINTNKKRPSQSSKNKIEKHLSTWISHQQVLYNIINKSNMKDEKRYILWNDFNIKYKEYLLTNEEKWYNKFEELKLFIDTHKKRPSSYLSDTIEKSLCYYLDDQIYNYKNKKVSMKDERKYNLWTEFLETYKIYFKTDDDIWYETFEKLKIFINTNKKRPSQTSEDIKEKTMSTWVSQQQTNYNKKDKSMKDERKYNLWTEFIKEYKKYFLTDDEKWYQMFGELKKFIDTTNTTPNKESESKNEKSLGLWVSRQKSLYELKKEAMSDETKYNLWTKFLETYKIHFKTDEEIWYENFEELKKFIHLNQKKPSTISKNETEKQLGTWDSSQRDNYKNKTYSMKDVIRYNLWTEFFETYKIHYKSNYELWYQKFEEVNTFIDINKKRPSQDSKNEIEKTLGYWIGTQLQNFKNKTGCMEDEQIFMLWQQFSNQNLISFDTRWYKTFEEVKQFIDINKKRPISKSKNEIEKQLGTWIQNQQRNYKIKKESMNDEEKYNLWTEFLEKYKEYLLTKNEIWFEKFDELKLFISEHKRNPSTISKNENEKKLGHWYSSQKDYYKNKTCGMKDENRYNLWSKFLEEFKEYLNISEEQAQSTTTTEQEEEKTKKIKSMKLPKQTTTKETLTQRRERTKSEISELHKEYKTLKSENLHNKFQENPDLWTTYHQIAEENEKSFPEEDIPRNRIIQQLDKTKTKRTKRIVDLGCGKGQISQYYKDDKRFQFYNYDHISSNDTIISCDISNIPLEEDSVEICILSLAMWGSNCREYIQEANRILETGGKLYIIEPTKRWSEKDELGNIIEGKEGTKLKSLLEENNFQIIEQSIDKFCMFVCITI
jgi:ribosomal RNA-processing protein 8